MSDETSAVSLTDEELAVLYEDVKARIARIEAGVPAGPEDALRELLGKMERARLQKHAAAEWARLTGAASALADSLREALALAAGPAAAPQAWAAWKARAEAALRGAGQSLAAVNDSLRRRVARLEGDLKDAREAAAARPPDLKPFVDRLEDEARRAHARLDELGVAPHGDLAERLAALRRP